MKQSGSSRRQLATKQACCSAYIVSSCLLTALTSSRSASSCLTREPYVNVKISAFCRRHPLKFQIYRHADMQRFMGKEGLSFRDSKFPLTSERCKSLKQSGNYALPFERVSDKRARGTYDLRVHAVGPALKMQH